MDYDFLSFIGGEDNNSLTNLLRTENDDNEVDNPVSNFTKHSAYFDHNSFLSFLHDNKNNFTVLSMNIASIRSKFDEIDIFINQISKHYPPLSAICIQETWLDDHDDISLFNLEGYICLSQGKTCSQRGGLLIYLNDNFNYNILKIPVISDVWECQVIEIVSNKLTKKVILGNVYRLPREKVADHKIFVDEFSPILTQLEESSAEVIIAGDFNINLLDIKIKDSVSTFFNTFTSHGYLPEITLPTRFSDRRGTLIDNFLCTFSDVSLKSKSGILIDKFSDHQPYFTSVNLRPPYEKKRSV